jgi:hypothetical protein
MSVHVSLSALAQALEPCPLDLFYSTVRQGVRCVRNAARYRIVSYTEYVAVTNLSPTDVFFSGSFVAYFRESDSLMTDRCDSRLEKR